MTSSRRDVVDIVLCYAGFLHDRLAMWAPSITTVRFDGVDMSEAASLGISRQSVGDGTYELRMAEGEGRREDVTDLACPVLVSGATRGWLVFEIPAGIRLAPDLERRLRRYADATIAGLMLDLPDEQWPFGLPHTTEALETRDLKAGSHLERVSGYVRIIVRALRGPLDLDDDYVEAVVDYSGFHDIGQVAVGPEFLRKPGRLDPSEWRLMQTHTTRGREIAEAMLAFSEPGLFPRPDVLLNVVELHHEALDGSGYPFGRSGDDVPLEARILMVADVFDALTSVRPYKPGWSADESMEEMDRMVAAGKIDGRCLTALVTQPDLVEAVAASGALAVAQ